MVATQVRTEADIESVPLRRYADTAAVTNQGRVSWGGIFAGSLFGMMFQFWLGMLGVAIGASTVDPLQEANPLRGLGIGSGLWIGFTVLAAAFIGGWVTGRFAGWRTRLDAALHGAVAWAVSNFVTFIVIGTVAGAAAGGATHLAGRAVSTPGQATSAMDQTRDAIQSGDTQEARQMGDTAAKAVSGTSFGLVTLMFLGLLAGIGGATLGASRMRKV